MTIICKKGVQDFHRAILKVFDRIVYTTGSYILQSKRIRMYKTETEATCLLCKDNEETMKFYSGVPLLRNSPNSSVT